MWSCWQHHLDWNKREKSFLPAPLAVISVVSLLSLLNSMNILHLWYLQYLWSSLQLRPTFTSSQLIEEPRLGNPTMPQVPWPQGMFRTLVQIPITPHSCTLHPCKTSCMWLMLSSATAWDVAWLQWPLCSFVAEPGEILLSSAWLKHDTLKLFLLRKWKIFK